MPRTTVDVDERALELAREELGTTGLSATVNAALREVGRRRALATFDVRRDVDGTPASDWTDEKGIARGRQHDRGPDIAWFKDPAGNVLAVLQTD